MCSATKGSLIVRSGTTNLSANGFAYNSFDSEPVLQMLSRAGIVPA